MNNNSNLSYVTLLHSNKSNRILSSTFLEVLNQKSSLSNSQWLILGILKERTNVTASYLSEEIGVKPSHITELLDGLNKLGYISRQKGRDDKREKTIVLSEKGERLIQSNEKSIRDKLKYLFSGVDKKDYESFKKVQSQIIKNYEELLDSPF